MREIEKAKHIAQAVKEINSIRKLLNQQEGEHVKIKEIIVATSKKYSIAFNLLDRIVNWEVREFEDLSKFTRIRDITAQTGISREAIVQLANDNFTTVLMNDVVLWVRNTLMPQICELNEKIIYFKQKNDNTKITKHN